MDFEEYKQKLPVNYSEEDLKIIKKAFEIASEIHKSEKRITGEPYIIHPIEVSLKAAELKMDAGAISAALLHDTEETKNGTLKKIRRELGEEIAFLVKSVTKASEVRYHGAERSAESARKMFMAMAQDIRVIIVKLLDRLHNLETLSVHPSEKQKRIANETLELYAAVADRLGMGDLKVKLEDAAFKYAFPKEYLKITKEVSEKISERERFLSRKITPRLKQVLAEEKISVKEISHRAKHYYSLWKKLERFNNDWQMIYDLSAVRIIVDSLEKCYLVLGIIHKLWKPIPGKIKDYIALPKQNGYQSLHTTVFCEGGKVTEFQIRTQEMHDEAEQGIAAHWAYKISQKPDHSKEKPRKKFNWIKQLREWHDKFYNGENGEDFLEALKIDFFKDRVFILTPKGDIIDLPDGATPVDFAYKIHTDLGNSMVSVKINGRIVPFSYRLASGDMVEIITQKNKKASEKMLGFAKTTQAKEHIREAIRKKE
ncbi:MAG: RelA/SpoT family protein [Candidatus Pacebacteria bacterium]|nr:RelA/SpoT family protein [Candidatus Paceibacterota bacterium]